MSRSLRFNFILLLVFTACAGTARATVHLVAADGSGEYLTIQAGLDAAAGTP